MRTLLFFTETTLLCLSTKDAPVKEKTFCEEAQSGVRDKLQNRRKGRRKRRVLFVEKSNKETGIDAAVEKKPNGRASTGRFGGNKAQSGGSAVKLSECSG